MTEAQQAKRVIIVDDEPIMRLDLSSMLEELGFVVVGEAADGFDAVERCRGQRPDIVLMDIKMPIFDGFGAAETIIGEDLADCVVLLTAFCDAEFIERANQLGVSGYLVKPIDQRTLLPAIEVALAQSVRLRESRKETREAIQKLEESRLIERAKILVARERGTSEGEAYRELQRMAMNKRCSILSLAETVVQRNSHREVVNRAKQFLMAHEGLSEQAAFKRLNALAKTHDVPIEQVAKQLLAKLTKSGYQR